MATLGTQRLVARITKAGTVTALMVVVVMAGAGVANAVPMPVAAFGTVVSVNGVSTAGTCGSAGTSGSFTVMTHNGSRDVAVTATTKFVAPQASSPSFANVCVGQLAGAVGTVSGSTLNARLVVVPPPLPREAQGIVASVNGVSTPGTCGTGNAGTFVLTTRTGTQTVAVTANTKFLIRPPAAPSFANVCVGGFDVAVGTTTNGTLNANLVITITRGK